MVLENEEIFAESVSGSELTDRAHNLIWLQLEKTV